MSHKFSILFCGLLLGCDMPSAEFAGAPMTEVVIDGSTFHLRRVDRRVEAIRVNFESRPNRRTLMRRGELAIEKMTGCPVTEIYGDVALMTGTLDCDRPLVFDEIATIVRPPRNYLLCDAISWGSGGHYDISCH